MPAKNQLNGLLAINKPTGLTSHDVVDQVRSIIKQRSVGHTGTLDPLASGLLLICLGKTTKLARFLSDQSKTYNATIKLGFTSTTMDAEGVDQASSQPLPDLSKKDISAILKKFEGRTMQTVPIHSAIKVDGVRLYEKARRGEEVKAPSREVTIHNLILNDISLPDISFTVNVSSGTYVRSLAHDIGQAIGCGAYLQSLSRDSIGSISIEQAISIDDLANLIEAKTINTHFISLDTALGFGSVIVSNEFSNRVAQGRILKNEDIRALEGDFETSDHIFLKNLEGTILAIGTAQKSSINYRDGAAGELFNYERVLV